MRVYNPATNEYGTVVYVLGDKTLVIRYDGDNQLYSVRRNLVEIV